MHGILLCNVHCPLYGGPEGLCLLLIQHFQLPILNFLNINLQYGYFSLQILNFLASDF